MNPLRRIPPFLLICALVVALQPHRALAEDRDDRHDFDFEIGISH